MQSSLYRGVDDIRFGGGLRCQTTALRHALRHFDDADLEKFGKRARRIRIGKGLTYAFEHTFGIGLEGELRGLIPTSRWKRQATGVPWHKGETISISIGQGFDLVTPLQMAMGYAAIANNGQLWQPYVVKRIEGGAANEIDEIKPKLKRRIPIEQRWFDLVKKGLSEVVENPRGTAHLIRDPVIQISGKTGTAQVVQVAQGVNRKLLAKLMKAQERDHAWFVGYAPSSDPRICVAAIIEHGGHGASAAAPLVQKVILAYLKNREKPDSS